MLIDNKTLKYAQQGKIDACTYGLGYLGKKLYEEIPGLFGVRALYYCDSNNQKVDSTYIPGRKGLYKEDLLKNNQQMVVFILVDDPYDLQIVQELSVNPNLITITLRELAEMDSIKAKYYGKEMFDKYLRLESMYREGNNI